MLDTLMAVVVEADNVWKSAYIPAVMAIVQMLKVWYGVNRRLIPPVVLALCIIGRAILFPGGFGLTNMLWGVLSGATALATYSGIKAMAGK